MVSHLKLRCASASPSRHELSLHGSAAPGECWQQKVDEKWKYNFVPQRIFDFAASICLWIVQADSYLNLLALNSVDTSHYRVLLIFAAGLSSHFHILHWEKTFQENAKVVGWHPLWKLWDPLIELNALRKKHELLEKTLRQTWFCVCTATMFSLPLTLSRPSWPQSSSPFSSFFPNLLRSKSGCVWGLPVTAWRLEFAVGSLGCKLNSHRFGGIGDFHSHRLQSTHFVTVPVMTCMFRSCIDSLIMRGTSFQKVLKKQASHRSCVAQFL